MNDENVKSLRVLAQDEYPSTVTAVGTVEFVAAAAKDGEEPKSGGCKAMKINAYNGGLMNVGWRFPVGIELSGLKWREDNAVPIMCLHETNDIDAICGQAKSIRCENGSLFVEADFMPVSDCAKKIDELAKAGFKFQASVGVSPSDVIRLSADESATLNGKECNGECYIVRAGTLNEVSIVPLGADGSTKTAIAAATTQRKEPSMATEKKEVEAAKPVETATVEAAQVERDRVSSVIAACKGHDDIMAEAVKNGWTAEKAELACLRAEKQEAEKAKIEASRAEAPSIINLKASAPKNAKTIVAAACMGAAMPDEDVEAKCKGVDLDAAHDLGIKHLSDVFAAFGYDYNRGDMAQTEKALKAAFSNADIPNVLSNVAHKFVLKGFGSVGEDWRKVSREVPVVDFKAVKGVRLNVGGVLQPLAKGGELKHVSLSDEARELAADTKGSIVGITREDLINDDLGVLAIIPEKFGQMAGRTINKEVFGSLSTTGSDYGANTTGALSLSTLSTAFKLAMEIKDADGNPLGTMPTKILVSPENLITALNIYQSEQLIGSASEKGKTNVLRGRFEPITTPFLSGTAYRLFDAAFPMVDVAFLNGRSTPVVETANADFNQLGIQMRCYYDFGVGKGELKAAVYSTGA